MRINMAKNTTFNISLLTVAQPKKKVEYKAHSVLMVIKGVNTIGRQNTHLSLKMWFIALHFGNLKVLDVVLEGVSLKENLET